MRTLDMVSNADGNESIDRVLMYDELNLYPTSLRVFLLVLLSFLTVTGYSQTIPPGANTLWAASTSPGTSDAGSDSSVELGVQFTSSVPGQVLGVRFYKSGNNSGPHTAHLWSSSGTSLASSTFSSETASGWQQVLFSSPVTVSANTRYVVSYHCPNGHYADDINYFSNAFTSGSLGVPANGGVYIYGPSAAFPRSTWRASNYYVDVVFLPTTGTVSISPTSTSLLTGGTQQFTATVTGTTNTAVTWSATGGTVSSSGLYTAPGTTGSYTVTATSQANPALSASASVTVTSTPAITVSISPTSASLLTGGNQQFTAAVTGTTNTAVTWSATGGTVSSSGLYTAPGTSGTYTVKATSQANTSVSASATVTVTTTPAIVVSVSPTSASVLTGATRQFTATVTGTTNTAVTWSATGGTVSSSGLYAAGSTAGAFSITATSQADTTKSASANVTITTSAGATTTVNFDSPSCPTSNPGTYGGINWSGYPWGCESAGYVNDSTNNVSWFQQVTSGKFSFVSPSLLVSVVAGGGSVGAINVSTDAGESTNLNITAANRMTSYQTGFSKPATVVTVSYGSSGSVGWSIALDDIVYTTSGSSVPQVWSVSGTVSPAASGSNTTLNLSGAASATATADTNGNYTFGNLTNGSYAVTPSKSGFTFSPTTSSAVVNGANVSGVNFAATASSTTYTLSGSVTPASLSAGATVTLGGATSASTTVNSNGSFAFSGLPNGTYTVTPSATGLSFSPASSPVTINGSNTTGVNFAATSSTTYSITGSISPAVGGAGATMTLSGARSAITTVNGSGIYTFSGLPAGSYTLTPSSNVATFSPSSQSASISNSSLTGVNFAATTTANIFFFDNFAGTTLSSDWTVISRHGEYAQSETECNIPQQVVIDNGLSITASAQNSTCGDFNVDGSVRHAPSSWPYTTGDIQWKSLNFTYGTVEIRGRFPANGTTLWPAFWLLGTNCQVTNPVTADVGYSTCPFLSSSAYAEIDMVECDTNNWCQLALSNTNAFPTCGFAVDTNYHIFTLTWNSTTVSVAMDGKYTGCSFTSASRTIPSTPMFLIMQIQTGGVGGSPNNALLPATLAVDYVRVTQP